MVTRIISLIIISTIALWLIPLKVFAYSVGVKNIRYYDEQRSRVLNSLVFFPTNSIEPSQLFQPYFVFNGYHAIPDAEIAKGKFPLLIIAHGSGGNNTNQAFIATELARRGMVVVAANHPGSTTGNSIPALGAQLWLQTEDISILLNNVLQDTWLNQFIDIRSIGALGHSKGGLSVLEIAGAQADLDKTIRYCVEQANEPNCAFYTNNGVEFAKLDRVKYEASYQDKRFNYIIALDPGYSTDAEYGTLFKLDSLQHIDVPILLMAAQQFKSDSPVHLHIDYLASQINPHYVTYSLIKDSTHFSFIAACTEVGVKALEEEGEPFVCLDGKRDRKEIQQEISQQIVAFINQVSVVKIQ